MKNDLFPIPRPFQTAAREALVKGFRAGHKNQLIMSPTGSGKTILSMYLINECLAKGKRAVFIADRKTLINQTSAVADSLGLKDHSVFMAQHWRFNPALPLQIASAQTIARRGWPEADLYIVDECHTQMNAWTQHVNDTKGAVVGLSATPFTDGLAKYFSNLINATSMHDLTESGVLVPMRVMSCTKIDTRGAKIKAGEWADIDMQNRGMDIVGDVLKEWKKYGENRKTIGFGATIRHCEALCQQFNEAGVVSAVFTAKTSDAERKVILDEFKNKESPLKVLFSVEALAKGFDNPFVECIIDCRPLRKSLSTAIQMWGRGLRSAPGKRDCILLDFSGNIIRFAQDYEDIFYNGLSQLSDAAKYDSTPRLETKTKDEPKCPKCQFTPFFARCMSCGYEKSKTLVLDHEPGVMMEFKIAGKPVGGKNEVWEDCVNACRESGNPNLLYSRSAHLYRSITKQEPVGVLHVSKVPVRQPSQSVLNKQKSNRIAFFYKKKIYEK